MDNPHTTGHDTDKIVEIARFQYSSEAYTLMALLQSEGIDCYLRNEYSSQLLAGYVDMGGVRVEIPESQVAHALEVMQAGGYELPDEDEEVARLQAIAGWARQLPFLRKLPLEAQILLLFLLLAISIGLLIFLGSL
jgi:hypothetical protein